MKWFIILGVSLVAIVAFVGYYPPFFPFLRYGLLPQPATKVVFQLRDVDISSKDFSSFLQSIDQTVRQSWHNDVRLAMITAFFVPEGNTVGKEVAYRLEFYCDSCPKSSRDGVVQLTVFYNFDLSVESDPISSWAYVEEEPIIGSNVLKFKYHDGSLASNNQLSAVECVDPFPCQLMHSDLPGRIEPTQVVLSGDQALGLALATKQTAPGEIDFPKATLDWFAILTSKEGAPRWNVRVGAPHPTVVIDATSGELLRW